MSDLPAWFDQQRERNNRRSRQQERQHATANNGKVQAGSGSSWRAPQDVRTPTHLDQLKFTDAASFRIDIREWQRTRADALRDGREPRLVISFERYGISLVVTEAEGGAIAAPAE
jgi:hypothetical protein